MAKKSGNKKRRQFRSDGALSVRNAGLLSETTVIEVKRGQSIVGVIVGRDDLYSFVDTASDRSPNRQPTSLIKAMVRAGFYVDTAKQALFDAGINLMQKNS